MDPFEDFEFKPLTEGLGFHKKSEKKSESKTSISSSVSRDILHKPTPKVETPVAKPTARKAATVDLDFGASLLTEPSKPSKSISDLINALPPSLDFDEPAPTRTEKRAPIAASLASTVDAETDRPLIFQPLGREEYKSPSTFAASPAPTIGQVLPSAGMTSQMPGKMSVTAPIQAASPSLTFPQPTAPSPFKERLDESFARAFPHAEKSAQTATRNKFDPSIEVDTTLEAVPTHFGAAFIDGMVVMGMSTILLVAIVAITGVNLMGLLTNAQTNGPTQMHLVLLFVAVLHLYMLTSRTFAGYTLGDWAFDLQLGSDDDQRKNLYPLQVAWRTLLATITGLVLLPLISLIAGRDILKLATGVQLYRKV